MKDSSYRDSKLVDVFVAQNETIATMIKDMLESEGIDALVRSDQIVWYDGIAKASRGYWGKVFVRDEDEEKARELVEQFLSQGEDSAH